MRVHAGAAGLQPVRPAHHLPPPAAPARAAAQPAGASAAVGPELAFNTAASFTTNTNWQSYAGESTMSYLTPDGGAGLAQLHLRGRGHRRGAGARARLHPAPGPEGRRRSATSGWTSSAAPLYVLLPICVVYALFLVSQGVLQNFAPYRELTTLEGAKQTLAMGPVASQEAIKMLGTNGGGFFNANSAHPFENPTPLTNLVQMSPSSPSPRRSPTRTGGWRGTRSRAGPSSRRMASSSSPAWRPPTRPSPGQRRRGLGAGGPGGQHGGQGGALRHRRLGALRHRHHRRLVRRRQRHARQLHRRSAAWCRW